MSLSPEMRGNPESQVSADAYRPAPPPPPSPAPLPGPRIAGSRRLWRVLFGLFAIEVGLFLAIYPWTDAWNLNHLPTLLQENFGYGLSTALEDFWDDPYFRGALTGLGAVNLWVGLREVIGLFSPGNRSVNSD